MVTKRKTKSSKPKTEVTGNGKAKSEQIRAAKAQEAKRDKAREVRVAAAKQDKQVKKAELKLPRYMKIQVVSILSGGHVKTHFHCKMANQTTMHVPKHLFKK